MRTLIYFSFILLIASPAFAEKIDFEKYNPSWGGIVAGISREEEVISIYGKGTISDGLGHGLGHCYTNKRKSSTLIVDIGVDNAVESVTIIKGLHFPPKSKPFISEKFDAEYTKDKSVLDFSKDKIRKLWGKPDKSGKDEFVYTSKPESEFKAIRVQFKNNKVESIQYYSGEPIDFYGDEYETQ